jgi:hypothetical protein
VKNLALRYAFGSCPVVQSAQENAGCSLFPPLLEQPGFSLACGRFYATRSTRTSENPLYANFSERRKREVRRMVLLRGWVNSDA